MHFYCKSIFTAVTLSMASYASAIPARQCSLVYTQPDGTTITIHLTGDEYQHFTLSDDNKLLVMDEDERFCYARLSDNGQLISTGVQATDAATRPAAHAAYTVDYEDINHTQKSRRRVTMHIDQTELGRFTTNFPSRGTVKGLIILAEFSNTSFKAYYKPSALQYFTDMLNEEGFNQYSATGSAKEYFREMSFDKFIPEFDVVGPYKLPNKLDYYGGNDENGDDLHPAQMIIDACRLADSDIDFSTYDNDGDGECDNVYVIYAGYSEAATGYAKAVWPHAWEITDATGEDFELDGVRIDRYACSAELLTAYVPDGIGTFVHEFSHVMGLPDLYHTTSKNDYFTPGNYSVMATGSYNNNSRTPPAYSSFERNAMGWIDLHVLSEPENITLHNLADSDEACLVETSQADEFFLFENRQQTRWDKYIPNHGMLIWHVDFDQEIWDNGTVNNERDHQRVRIVKANNNSNGSNMEILMGWPWPGSEGKTEFTSTTVPAFYEWSGTAIDMPITDIKEDKKGEITFKVKGGAESSFIDALADENNANAEVYTLTGQRITRGSTTALPAGLYIVRTATGARKISVK